MKRHVPLNEICLHSQPHAIDGLVVFQHPPAVVLAANPGVPRIDQGILGHDDLAARGILAQPVFRAVHRKRASLPALVSSTMAAKWPPCGRRLPEAGALLGCDRWFRQSGIGRRLVLEAELGASNKELLAVFQKGLADSHIRTVGALEIDQAPAVIVSDERLPQFGVATGDLRVVGNDQVAFRSTNHKPIFADANRFAILSRRRKP